MGFSIFKAFSIFGIVSAWAAKALEDGKITVTEAAELAVKLAAVLGIPTSIVIPNETSPYEARTETTGNPSTGPPEGTHAYEPETVIKPTS
jgi:hypothetical protein